MAIIFLAGGIQDTVYIAFAAIPIITAFTKICPKGIEATCYALALSIFNIRQTLRELIGVGINEAFLHVSNEDLLTNYWKMTLIVSLTGIFVPLITLKLIPTNE